MGSCDPLSLRFSPRQNVNLVKTGKAADPRCTHAYDSVVAYGSSCQPSLRGHSASKDTYGKTCTGTQQHSSRIMAKLHTASTEDHPGKLDSTLYLGTHGLDTAEFVAVVKVLVARSYMSTYLGAIKVCEICVILG